MKLSEIISSITGGKAVKRTAAELRASLAEIDLAALERKVTEIERQRRDLLLRGTDAELLAITQDLTAANLEAERGQAAVDALKDMVATAQERERRENIEARAASAREVQAAMISKYLELHEPATNVAELLRAIDTGRRQLQPANQELLAAGRSDLKIQFPEIALAERNDWNPQSLPAIAAFALPGYWPNKASDRLFDRFADLVEQATPSKRAA